MASHTLRQRAEVDNIRYAYESKSGKLSSYHSASSSSGSERSYRQQRSDSDRSYQTQPTEYSGSSDKRPSIRSYDTCEGRVERSPDRFFPEKEQQASPRTSSDTYASTVVSEDEEETPEDIPEYALPEYIARPYDSGVLPATPSDFSDLFPSHRKLTLRHDDSTLDGNMNLRVDTDVLIGGRKRDMTLFHLRMHDLKNREFSLRRYCRDSGREVCHSVQKHQKPIAEKRPGFQRSLSNALNSIRPRSEARTPTLASLKRNDSGYGSMHSVDFDQKERPRSAGNATEQATNHTVKLEFSNYAQVEIKRTGTKANKRYDFEYWGVDYSWKHVARKDNHTKQVSFALFGSGSEQPLAFIVPVPLSRSQAHNERKKGGWIPPCTMWISDSKIVNSQKDVSDVIVSAGLIALVDNAIRDRFHSKPAKQALLPKVEYVGPKRFINEMFRRDSNGSEHAQIRTQTCSRPSMSRHRESHGSETSQGRPQTRSRPSTSHGSSSTASRLTSTAVPRAVRQASYEY